MRTNSQEPSRPKQANRGTSKLVTFLLAQAGPPLSATPLPPVVMVQPSGPSWKNRLPVPIRGAAGLATHHPLGSGLVRRRVAVKARVGRAVAVAVSPLGRDAAARTCIAARKGERRGRQVLGRQGGSLRRRHRIPVVAATAAVVAAVAAVVAAATRTNRAAPISLGLALHCRHEGGQATRRKWRRRAHAMEDVAAGVGCPPQRLVLPLLGCLELNRSRGRLAGCPPGGSRLASSDCRGCCLGVSS